MRTVYQPIIDLRTGACVGYEALTRVAEWPARSPQPWFAAAVRSGKGTELEAAALLSALRGRVGLPADRFLAVNLGSQAIGEAAVLDLLLAQDDLHGLVTELTDVLGVVGEGRHGHALAALRARGLALAVDVADGGLLELEQVAAVAPDLVKLERGLVKGIHADPVRERVVRSASWGSRRDCARSSSPRGSRPSRTPGCCSTSASGWGRAGCSGGPAPGSCRPPPR
ncbi:MAG: EAL domain-containing protein [Kineosporiaceae bacterium]